MEHVGREPAGFRLLGGAGPLRPNPGACRHGPLQGMGVSERVDGEGGRAWSGFADGEAPVASSLRHLFYFFPSISFSSLVLFAEFVFL
jgi:hypothetical protein